MRAFIGPSHQPLATGFCLEACEVWTVLSVGRRVQESDTGGQRGAAGWSQESSSPEDGQDLPCRLALADSLTLRAPRGVGSTQPLLLPLFRDGSFKGMLTMPTKSSVGTRERRIDLIRRASPFPVWISCRAGLESKTQAVPRAQSHPLHTSGGELFP